MFDVLMQIAEERRKQDEKFGEQNHPMVIEGMEDTYAKFARIYKDSCDDATRRKRLTWRHIMEEEFWEAMAEKEYETRRQELVQLAAVVVAAIESEDRKHKK